MPPGTSGGLPGPADALDPEVFGVFVTLEADAPGFLGELIGEFRDGATRRVSEVRAAVEGGDTDLLKAAAHSLRGCCGTLGARRMAGVAARLEDAPPTTREQGWALLSRLEAEYGALRVALAPYAPEAVAGAPAA